ncbi:hypothetical protein D0864_12392 [Hortaea werneckii]|uniref:3-phytase n=1 Tax=Hortaea werneckii TaxID=91943 RepID=A0A3M7DIV0_HORWE|nr:phosphoglycerate mutase-like protein [Hortaea werneckii]KAI7345071.1 phosphoglycerate mutase-like protein [Hortaea werneckii]RMY64301.1 hypothetical protein D0864_12392 [Hortaea werneckii]
MTTLQPRPPYTSDELSSLYPSHLELQQVQIILRHGERTPVSARFKNAGLPAYWPYCEAARNFKDVVLSADRNWDTLHWRRRLETFTGNGNDSPVLSQGPGREVDAICQPGELTDRGRETTLALGERVRRLYVDQLGFLPAAMDNASANMVYLRSTPIQRALESTQQAFTGLYPAQTRSADFQPPDIVTRSMQDEVLFPNEGGCKRFAQLAAAFAERTAKVWNESPEMAHINKRIGKWMPKESSVVKIDSHPRLSGIMDTVNATLAHGTATKLPSEFYEREVVANIDRICTEEWFIGYQESNEYRKLGIGALIGDLTQRMVEHVNGSAANTQPGEFKLSLAGCHDTTIASALSSLGAFDVASDKWPNYTSSIAFELFKRKPSASTSTTQQPAGTTGTIWPSKEKTWWYALFSSPKPTTTARTPLADLPSSEQSKLDEYFVRLRYNDKPVTLPYCQQKRERHLDGDESFCTLAAFKEAADSITPKDWKTECKSNLGEPAFKPIIERPPGVA